MNADEVRPEEPLLITASQLSEKLQISVRTVWSLLSAGELLEPVRIRGNTRWRLHEVEHWIANGCPPPRVT